MGMEVPMTANPFIRITDEMRREIEQRAYLIWESEGCPHGRDHEHWQRAEAEILAEHMLVKATSGEPVKKAKAKAAKPAAKKTAAKTVEAKPAAKAPAKTKAAAKTKHTAKSKTAKKEA